MRAWPFFAAAALLFAIGVAHDAFDRWVDDTSLPPTAIATSTEVLARDGTLLRAYTVDDGRWRLALTPEETDPAFLRMLVAYEDKRFAQHRGVDPLAVLRAVRQAVTQGRVVSGGSTLTMQVARLLEDGPTGSWKGKLRQTRLALALERRLSKRDILAIYLERAPYGGNIEGLRAASRAWFGKDPRRLTPAEAALLIALPQSPETRRPDRNRAAAIAARDRVLARMVEAGVLDADTAAAAMREPVPSTRRAFPTVAPHLADRLIAETPDERVVRTTIDAETQRKLERLATRVAREAGDRLSVAILVADHRTGEVLASVGSAGYHDGPRGGYLDMTRALRSPGSTLKPFVYGLAFDLGLAHPETLIEDRPVAFGTYAPQNFDGGFRGTVTLRDALQLSLNIPAVELAEAITPDRLTTFMRAAGAPVEIPGRRPGLAVVLGGLGTSLEGLTQLYAGLAEQGAAVELRYRLGAVPVERRQLMRREAAWMVGDILAGLAPPAGAPADRIAYKTGTSYGHRDAWAIGFDGRHVIGVWMGRPDGTSVPGAFGAALAAPVLFEAFTRLKPALDRLPPPPQGTLIAATGQLPRPLQRFRGRDALFRPAPDAPSIAFPPDGAVLASVGTLVLKVRDGVAPFTWLADGRPLASAEREREVQVSLPGRGFVTLSVVDAEGRSARSLVRIDWDGTSSLHPVFGD
ncbi:penicillin-binding protein 1C [Jannaschia seohaensis]|uniref:peptidoglycan glycosyltransferase n=1 Tax=Jannaschia seohaensis TaxID=475081 RepID=A0A2Y9B5J4_9RHOB|nr:penicillin-binding protein 1C [Jannaschia seohaensis]PWJ11769.1 penicillin-binding protein 1C [Jannaschia seohaensis]SSA51285.1 penicillin-binding protein 1C [Jannaschia seohaensis]